MIGYSNRIEKRGGKITMNLVEALQDELLVLVAIAKSDNRMDRNERDIIVRYAEERAKDKGLAFNESAATDLHAWVKKQDPTTSQVRQILERLAKADRSALNALHEVSEIVAELDDKIKPGEQRQLADVQATIKRLLG